MRTVGGDAPQHDDARSRRDRFSPPSDEVPVPVALSVPLVRTEDLSVVASGFEVFSSGVAFDVRYRSRTGFGDALHRSVGGHDPWGEAAAVIGVEYADGRWASTLEDHRFPGDDPEVPSLQRRRTSSGEHGGEQDLWLTPGPPAGPLVLVFACAALGVDETAVTVDATPLAEAARDVDRLWPEQPPVEPVEHERELPAPPDLPPGSRFGERLSRGLAEGEARGRGD